jgi:diphthine synthase
MAELVFIGAGLYDEMDISIRGLAELQSCTQVFAEFYTSKMKHLNKKNLEHQIGKPVTLLNRQETEKATVILESASRQKTGFLVCGDPMMATTHIDLRVRAIKQGITTKIIHNASIITAAPGLLGLQNYKFGRTTTLTFPENNYFPMSPYLVIQDNKNMGLHSLILLDIQSEKDRYMTAKEGLDLLLQMEKHHKKHIIKPDTVACVVGQAGNPEPLVKADTIQKLLTINFNQPLHTLVIPGKLHFMEIEALEICAGLPHAVALKLQKL